jgi:hypothetical protein
MFAGFYCSNDAFLNLVGYGKMSYSDPALKTYILGPFTYGEANTKERFSMLKGYIGVYYQMEF